MSLYCNGQFDDADATSGLGSEVALADAHSTPAGEADIEDDDDSEDDDWDLLGDDDDICADFEEETKDFTKKLNAARGSGGRASSNVTKKGVVEKTLVQPVPKSIQVSLLNFDFAFNGSTLCS